MRSVFELIEGVIDLRAGWFVDGQSDDWVLGYNNWSWDIGDYVTSGTSLFLVPPTLASSIIQLSASSLASKSTPPLHQVVPATVVNWSRSSILVNNGGNVRRRVVGLTIDGMDDGVGHVSGFIALGCCSHHNSDVMVSSAGHALTPPGGC